MQRHQADKAKAEVEAKALNGPEKIDENAEALANKELLDAAAAKAEKAQKKKAKKKAKKDNPKAGGGEFWWNNSVYASW